MAIQNRRGIYGKFDSSKMLPGEYAIVLSGDPSTVDGKAVYICFAAGNVKRLATIDDLSGMQGGTLVFPETIPEAWTNAIMAAVDAKLDELDLELPEEMPETWQTQVEELIDAKLAELDISGTVDFADDDVALQAFAERIGV